MATTGLELGNNVKIDAALLEKYLPKNYEGVAKKAAKAVQVIKSASEFVEMETLGDLRQAPPGFWASIDPVLADALKETFVTDQPFRWYDDFPEDFTQKEKYLHDMILRVQMQSSLEYQQQFYGPLLKHAFPPLTRDAGAGRPGWAMMYIRVEDMIDQQIYQSFKKMVSSLHENTTQVQELVAPLQLSGAGKTKLCVSLGMQRGAVIIRLNKYKTMDATPIHFVLTGAMSLLSGTIQNKYDFYSGAQKVVDLWVLAHIAYYKAFHDWYKKQAEAFPDDYLNEFFLRTIENGGASCIQAILASTVHYANPDLQSTRKFSAYKSTLLSYAKEHIKYIVFDDIVGVEKFYVGYFPHFRDLAKEVVVAHQDCEVTNNIPGGEYLRSTNLMYAFHSFADSARGEGIVSIFTGTKFSAVRALVLGSSTTSGPSRDRATFKIFPTRPDYCWPLPAKAEDLAGFLATFLDVPLRPKYYNKLQWLQYRPERFFDNFLPELEKELAAQKPTDQEVLIQIIDDALTAAVKRAKQSAKALVNSFMNSRSEPGKDLAIMKLLYFLVMHNGHIKFVARNNEDAVAYNMAWLINSKTDGLNTVMAEKPIIHAINKLANELVTSTDPDNDPVFLVLATAAEVATSDATLGEEISARVFQRCNSTVYELVQDPHKQGISENGISSLVTFNIGTCGTYKEFNYDQLSCMTTPTRGRGIFPGVDAKPDFRAELPLISDTKVIPLMCQFKNYKDPLSLAFFVSECLYSLDPRKFFKGKATHMRRDWLDWWLQHSDYFNDYIRIVVSLSGFKPEVYTMVALYNQQYGDHQPIILLHPQRDLIGSLANNANVIKCRKDISTSSKTTTVVNILDWVVPPITGEEKNQLVSDTTSPITGEDSPVLPPPTKKQKAITSFFSPKKAPTQ